MKYKISAEALKDIENIWLTLPKLGLLDKRTDITT